MPGSVIGAVAGKAASTIGNSLFGGKKKSTPVQNNVGVSEADLAKTEGEALEYMDPTAINPQLNQLTQDAIRRATEKAGAQLGVTQAQQGITGGQAAGQSARQAGEITRDLEYSDALNRRNELLKSRADKAQLKSKKLGLIAGA